MIDKLTVADWVALLLPRKVVTSVLIRAVAHASMRPYTSENIERLTVIELIRRWELNGD